jgi:hypothetical protein
MTHIPPIDAQFHLFSAVRQAIMPVVSVPVFALQAPPAQSPPFIVLRLQDDVRKLLYVDHFCGKTLLSVVAVAETSASAWQFQHLIQPVLHRQTLSEGERSFFFAWDRSLPLEYYNYYSAITLYSVTIL